MLKNQTQVASLTDYQKQCNDKSLNTEKTQWTTLMWCGHPIAIVPSFQENLKQSTER